MSNKFLKDLFRPYLQKRLLWPVVAFVAITILQIIWQSLVGSLDLWQKSSSILKIFLWDKFADGLKDALPWSLTISLAVFIFHAVNSLYWWHEDISKTFYKGFHILLAEEIQKDFEDLEKQIENGASSEMRGIIFDFIIRCLASFGKNGYTVVDASIDEYVRYISETARIGKYINMTCTVRPYWFVVDKIENVTLAPYEGKGKYGKGEHLRFFKRKKGFCYKRYLIVDEHMLAEIFLTSYIDKYLFKLNVNKCPVCISIGENLKKCPIHYNRLSNNTISDLPEITWFKEEVNEGRGVDLLYTLVREERRKIHKELDDRVYVKDPEPSLDIRYNFTNLERGILKIRWGYNKAQKLECISIPRGNTSRRMNPETGSDAGNLDPKGHTFYNNFSEILSKEELKETIVKYLMLLKEQLQKQPVTNIGNLIRNEYARKLLADGNNKFREIVTTSVDELINELKINKLNEIYKHLTEHYKSNGIPTVAYVVTYDPAHPECPLRVAQWKKNWDGILNA